MSLKVTLIQSFLPNCYVKDIVSRLIKDQLVGVEEIEMVISKTFKIMKSCNGEETMIIDLRHHHRETLISIKDIVMNSTIMKILSKKKGIDTIGKIDLKDKDLTIISNGIMIMMMEVMIGVIIKIMLDMIIVMIEMTNVLIGDIEGDQQIIVIKII